MNGTSKTARMLQVSIGIGAIAAVQGCLAAYKYHNNPQGSLIGFGDMRGEVNSSKNEASQNSNANKNNRYNFLKSLQHQLRREVTKPVIEDKEEYRILLIGDSFAAGVGSAEVWKPQYSMDSQGDSTSSKLEQHGPHQFFLPEFLSRTLHHRLDRNIYWRSKGIIGGDIDAIMLQSLVVLESIPPEEKPDAVVIFCGMNDIKKICYNPREAISALAFRHKLRELVRGVHRSARPNTIVVLPAMPNIRQIPESSINIFPLNFILDNIKDLWDLQKHYIAKELPGAVTFINKPERLIENFVSADGVHPNSQGYKFWGSYIGENLSEVLRIRDENIQKRATHLQRSNRRTQDQVS